MFLSGQSTLSSQAGENFSKLPVGVALHGLSKIYGDRMAIENLNVSFYEGHVTSLLGHNGAGKTTTMYVGYNCLSFYRISMSEDEYKCSLTIYILYVSFKFDLCIPLIISTPCC